MILKEVVTSLDLDLDGEGGEKPSGSIKVTSGGSVEGVGLGVAGKHKCSEEEHSIILLLYRCFGVDVKSDNFTASRWAVYIDGDA